MMNAAIIFLTGLGVGLAIGVWWMNLIEQKENHEMRPDDIPDLEYKPELMPEPKDVCPVCFGRLEPQVKVQRGLQMQFHTSCLKCTGCRYVRDVKSWASKIID